MGGVPEAVVSDAVATLGAESGAGYVPDDYV